MILTPQVRMRKLSFVWAAKTYHVRVIKVVLSSGETETLVTNLSSKTFPTEEAGMLYFKRWGIETKFDSLKNRLALENMSGRRPVTVYQDFWATMYIANIFAALQYRTDAIISEKTEDSGNKYATATSAPYLSARSRREAMGSTMMVCAPEVFAVIQADSPIGPAPNMITSSDASM